MLVSTGGASRTRRILEVDLVAVEDHERAGEAAGAAAAFVARIVCPTGIRIAVPGLDPLPQHDMGAALALADLAADAFPLLVVPNVPEV
jgi:hypothetical protein